MAIFFVANCLSLPEGIVGDPQVWQTPIHSRQDSTFEGGYTVLLKYLDNSPLVYEITDHFS